MKSSWSWGIVSVTSIAATSGLGTRQSRTFASWNSRAFWNMRSSLVAGSSLTSWVWAAWSTRLLRSTRPKALTGSVLESRCPVMRRSNQAENLVISRLRGEKIA